MNEQEIYQKIGELLWSIMATEARIIFCEGYIYPDTNSCSFEWLTQNDKKDSFEFDEYPVEIGNQIISLITKLRALDIFREKWTHFKISLTEEEKIGFEFAYIPEEDSWVSLYMKGISDLSEEELDKDYPQIPKDLWKERLRIKNSYN
jgi:Fe-S cluster biosynthesis and repair protein YggX